MIEDLVHDGHDGVDLNVTGGLEACHGKPANGCKGDVWTDVWLVEIVVGVAVVVVVERRGLWGREEGVHGLESDEDAALVVLKGACLASRDLFTDGGVETLIGVIWEDNAAAVPFVGAVPDVIAMPCDDILVADVTPALNLASAKDRGVREKNEKRREKKEPEM